MAVLVDTGAVELLRRGDRRAETLSIQHYPPLVCRHVVAEFLYGQILAGASPSTLIEAQVFLAGFECLNPGETSSLIYARLRADLQKQGIRLPDPDYWVAAHCLENHLGLITTDTDFRAIRGLHVHLVKV